MDLASGRSRRNPVWDRPMMEPLFEAAVTEGTLIQTDKYSIYARLPAWGHQRKTVCHGRGEYARDEDGDGFCEVHLNTTVTAPEANKGQGGLS